MILKPKVLSKVNNKLTRARLALALQVSDKTISRFIKDNAVNGDLTKSAALKIIKRDLGLKKDSELLEDVDQ